MDFVIADSQEAPRLLECEQVLGRLTVLLRQRGVALQRWVLDDEIVVTVAACPISKPFLEKKLREEGVFVDPDSPLHELPVRRRRAGHRGRRA